MNIENQDNIIDNGSQNYDQLSMNYSPIKTQDSRFMDLSPADTIFNDRPPRFYRKKGDLRSVEEIPSKYQNLFESFSHFNLVQSRVMDNALYTDKSLVVSAPTGSGKTTIFELAIVRLMMAMEDIQYTGDFKIIYMAPIKSLCSERLCDWNRKFSEIGLSCIEVTGDTDRLDFKTLENFKIIITTPEKWDSITRKWKDNKEIVKVVKLFMIDEIHLLNDRKRGPTLEAVVSRMKIIQKSIEYELKQTSTEYNNSDELVKNFLTHIRFVALSATIKNIEDIGQWLGDNTKRFMSSATIQEFGEEYRPVQLNKIVLGYMCPSNSTPFKFDLSLNYKLKSVIEEYSNNKPTLVFCTTRKGLTPTAEILCKSLTFRFSETQKDFLRNSLKEIHDKKLKEMLEVGIGWHHAGMDCNDRCIVENLFRAGVVPVLLTTSTLSMGVNLPAHLVIIKSTEMYQSTGYENYTQIALQQMIGRAGRPQYDSTATAVIMTTASMQKFYENMIMGTEIIESNLHKHLGEHLNAEIVLRTITDLLVALDWIKTTFLYIRVFKNPRYYGITQSELTPEKIESQLIVLCQIEINKLKSLKLVKTETELGVDLKPTRNGELMAQYYLTFSTMQLFIKINGTETLLQLINMISDSDEFSDIRLRVNDKKILNTLNKNKFTETIRFPMSGRITNLSMKVNCIIQAVFGALPIHESSLRIESDQIIRIGDRISHCLCQYLITQEKGFVALRNALILSKCFAARLWENSKYVSRQFERVGPVTANLLASAGKITFNDIFNSNPRDLERICNRGPPFGNTLINFVKHIPKFSLRIIPPDVAASPPRCLTAIIEFSNFDHLENMTTTGKNHVFAILIGDNSNNILFYKKYRDEDVLMAKTLTHQVQLVQTMEHEVIGCVISETWVGLDLEITRKMPPINHYLINAFKKYENSELNRHNSASNSMKEINMHLSQLNQNFQQLDETVNDHEQETENTSELDSSYDVLQQIISSVFNNKSSLMPNDNNLKQTKNSSTQKESKIFAAVTPYVDDQYLNKIPSSTSIDPRNLISDSQNLKNFYENFSIAIQDSSSTLPNTSVKDSSDNLNICPENSNANPSSDISFKTARNVETRNNFLFQTNENSLNICPKNANAHCSSDSPLKTDKNAEIRKNVFKIDEDSGVNKYGNIDHDTYSQMVVPKVSYTPEGPTRQSIVRDSSDILNICPENTNAQCSSDISFKTARSGKTRNNFFSIHDSSSSLHNTPVKDSSDILNTFPENAKKLCSSDNFFKTARNAETRNNMFQINEDCEFKNSNAQTLPNTGLNKFANIPKQMPFDHDNCSQKIVPKVSYTPEGLSQSMVKDSSDSLKICLGNANCSPNISFETAIKGKTRNNFLSIHDSNSSLHKTPVKYSSDTLNIFPENAKKLCSSDNSFITARNTETRNNMFQNDEDCGLKNSNAQTLPKSSLNKFANIPKQMPFNLDNSQNVIPNVSSYTSKDLSHPIELQTPNNYSKSSNVADIQHVATILSQKCEQRSINLENPKLFSNTHAEVIPKNNSNIKQVTTSLLQPTYPDNVCSNPMYSKFIRPQHSIIQIHSEIKDPPNGSTLQPPVIKLNRFDDAYQNMENKLTFISPETISLHTEFYDSKNTDIYKPKINFEQTVRSKSQTNSLNIQTYENQESVQIPNREPSFKCEQGNIWIEENECPNFSNLSQNSKSTCSVIIENPVENLDTKLNNTELSSSRQILDPKYETVSDEEEKNSSLIVETSNDLDKSLNPEEIEQPTKKIKYDDHGIEIGCCQVYRHKKFSKLTIVPEENLNSQCSSEKLSCFKQTKKQFLPKTPNIKIIRVDNVQYPNISELITSPKKNTTRNISWRSPLTSEIHLSTPNSSCSSSDVSSPMTMTKLAKRYPNTISSRSPLRSEQNISTPNSSCSSFDSPMTMTKLDKIHPNTIRIEDYETSKISTAHSLVKIGENSLDDIHQKMTYSVQERKYVVREIKVKQTIDHSSAIPTLNHNKNNARKEQISRSTSVHSSKSHTKGSHSDSYNSIRRNSGSSISLEQEQSASNSKLEFHKQNNIKARDHYQPSRYSSRKNEKLHQINRNRSSSEAVKNSTTFKKTMKNILTQLSDKGASEASKSSSENNDVTQELFIPSNIQDYSVRSDFSVSDYKTKPQEVFHSKTADAIYKKCKLSTENLEKFSNDKSNNNWKDKPKLTLTNDDNISQENHEWKGSYSENTCEKPTTCEKSYSLFENKRKLKSRPQRESSNYQMSFNFNPFNKTSNFIEPINIRETTSQSYARNTHFVKDSNNISNESKTFFNLKNSQENDNPRIPLNYSVPNRNRNIETRHHSNYVLPTIENSNKIALRKNFSRQPSSKNMVRLEDGPLVDLNEVNQFIDHDNYNHKPMDAHQQNLFDLSPKSFIQTFIKSSTVSEKRYKSRSFNLF